MTHVCCPSCRLRFAPAIAAYLEECPSCGEPLQPGVSAQHLIGFSLVTQDDLRAALPGAIAVTLPHPDPREGPPVSR
jgi:hypothetical protein